MLRLQDIEQQGDRYGVVGRPAQGVDLRGGGVDGDEETPSGMATSSGRPSASTGTATSASARRRVTSSAGP
ncbi:hypothetical protein [Streptomyces sp. NPDC048106]|uniref:hypothetical protein n=1 Tax=Streptomyces sp. NPDC048106 TaxID=3155750 RepID=UPI00345262FA